MSNYSITKAMLKPVNTTAIVLLGIYTVVWGFWLGNPWWSAFNRAPLYSKMAQFMPEEIWGGLAMIAGVIICYGAFRPSYHALTIGSTTAFLHWFTIAVFYFWGDWQNTGGITSLTFAIYAAFIYLNIRVNYRQGNMELNEILK